MLVKNDKKVLDLKIASFNFWMINKMGFKATVNQINHFVALIGEQEIGSNYDQESIYKQAVLKAVGL